MESNNNRLIKIFTKLPENFRQAKTDICKEKGKRGSKPCLIRLEDLSDYLILSGDDIPTESNEKSCDCLIFIDFNQLFLCLVELKSNSFDPTKTKQKFDNTRERIHNDCTFLRKEKIEPKFLLVYQNINPIDYEQLLGKRFELLGKTRQLLFRKCGSQIMSVLNTDT